MQKVHLTNIVKIVMTLLCVTSLLFACSYSGVKPSNLNDSMTLVNPPNPPSNLTYQAVSTDTIALQWLDNSNNEGGFNLYRDGKKISSINNTVFQDNGLEIGQNYQYVVKAYNSAGESAGSTCSAKTKNPPISVTINHIGVLFDHDPSELVQGAGDIRLIVLVSDGKQTIQQVLPLGDSSFSLNDYETTQLDQVIFHSSEVGDFLNIAIMAYDDDPESLVSDLVQTALPILGPMLGVPYAVEVGTLLSKYKETTGHALFENKDDFVGYYNCLWGSDQKWGIGQYKSVGSEDFRVWISIWSKTKDALQIEKPSLQPPLQNLLLVNFDGWYVEGNKTNSITTGKSIIARVNISGGTSGTYVLNLKQDVSMASDKIITSKSFSYAGTNTFVEIPFTPTTTGTYHLELTNVTSTVWSQPNDNTRLNVQEPPSISITSFNFVPNPTTTGQPVSLSITLTGGSTGTYNLNLRKDVSFGTDQLITSYSIVHNGTGTTKSFSFVPTTEGSYHVDLQYNSTTIWSQSNDSSRLFVSSPEPVTFSLQSFGFSPVTTTVGHAVNISFGIAGGSSGTYSLRLIKDINFAPDQVITVYSIKHNGTTTTQNFSFIPSSTGSYHLDLQLNGSTIWSQPNDSSRLKVN
jgi:hypothetical protein